MENDSIDFMCWYRNTCIVLMSGVVKQIASLIHHSAVICFFFFFQAEDGIRDVAVTGVQTCALPICSYFKEPNHALANQLLGEQLEDGGWNCEAWPFLSPKRPPSRRSSFHTTICVLEGLLEYERAGRKSAAVTKARKRAENYLLERRMLRSLRTGKVIDKRWLRFSFPTFWHYDVLRGLDYLRNAGIKPDSHVRDAIEI